mgnify:CR=1 FL=1|tara:strand:+ start:850 stop:1725 length:876 start_codon:yes stop_codon:yes gene_type:complete
MKKIFWIASYPKSGNTWMRAILSGLFFTKNGKFDLNLLNYIINFDNPDKYQFVRNLSAHDYKNLHKLKIISKYWVKAQQKADVGGDFAFFKTHSANVKLDEFNYTVADNVLGVIYIVRDPRDVVVSYSKHLGYSVDETIRSITSNICITWSGLPKKNPYPILLSSWDLHYKTWKKLNVPKLIIKYETLLEETEVILKNIVSFLSKNYGFNFNNIDSRVKNIIKTTDFKRLQEIEKKSGFIESTHFHSKKNKGIHFFRKGTSNQWESVLTNSQIKKIEDSFESTMKELGYLK